jgi:hypothetical protein
MGSTLFAICSGTYHRASHFICDFVSVNRCETSRFTGFAERRTTYV